MSQLTSTRRVTAAALLISLMIAFMLPVAVITAQTATKTPPASDLMTQQANAVATQAALQTQMADVQATISAIEAQLASGENGESDEEWITFSKCGFSIDLPAGYIDAEANLDEMGALLRDLDTSFDANYVASAMEMLGDMCFLLVLDLDNVTSVYVPNLNVLPFPMPVALPIDLITSSNANALVGQGIEVETEMIELDGEEVGRVFGALSIGGIDVRQVQYYILKEDTLYIITYSTTEDQFDEFQDIVEDIALTLRVDE